MSERVNIENSSGDPSSVDDGQLRKPSKSKYGPNRNRTETTRLDTVSEIEALLDTRNIYRASCISLICCVRNFKQASLDTVAGKQRGENRKICLHVLSILGTKAFLVKYESEDDESLSVSGHNGSLFIFLKISTLMPGT